MSPAGGPDDGRPSFAAGDDVPALRNEQLARIFHEIADVLEIEGELAFKIGAYRRAANSIAHTPIDVVAAYRAGSPPRLEGVGKAIDEKLAELADTGRMRYHEQLLAKVPPSLVTLLSVPGIGPRTAGDLWRALGVATLADLETAAREGRLREVKGISAKTEQRILEGIAELETRPPNRMHMAEARDVADRLAMLIETYPGVRTVTAAGSVRRGRETVGDLDLLVETDQPAEVLAAVRTMAAAERVVAGLRTGEHRVSVQLLRGPQADVMTYPPGRAARTRSTSRARPPTTCDSGNGHGTRAGASRSTASRAWMRTVRSSSATMRRCAPSPSETEVYDFLGLPFIEPELREDRGEIEAALAGRLPTLVTAADLLGDCHSHSEWSDGKESVETVAETARRRGYAYQVLTDHSWSLTIANGLSPAQVEQQRVLIRELNERFAREEAAGEVPEGAHPSGFRLLHGCELEIRVDGRLDYEDDLLAQFDVVVASLHVGRKQPRAQLMARYETALRSPHVDIIAHPSGRKIDQRPDLDLDWEAFYRLAAETGTLLEVNGSDERLDLADRRVRSALDAGCRFTIDSDAHYLSEWDNVLWGTAQARRGWLEAHHVANTLPRDAFLALMAEKPHRL